NRGEARKLAAQLPQPAKTLDEQPARLVAVSQGINVVVTGALRRQGSGYKLAVAAVDAVSGNTFANSEATTASKDEVLPSVSKLAGAIRQGIGDSTPESAHLAPAETVSAGPPHGPPP